jgi:abortive infection bacteriophage resistance protein
MQIGYVLGEVSPFAHIAKETFVSSFTDSYEDPDTRHQTSRHIEWLRRVDARVAGSDEAFVTHFREKYGGQMPIWALTEVLELGHLGRLYGGLSNSFATKIAQEYGAPSKKTMASWIASVNYVRNVAAHHARLFNRKLVAAPSRPPVGVVPLLDHLRNEETAKAVYGLYGALAVTAYLLRSIERQSAWPGRVTQLVQTFPATPTFSIQTMGIPPGWLQLDLWKM